MPRNYHVAKAHILQAMPGTHNELVAKSGWTYETVRRWLKVLRRDSLVHIGDWARPNGSGHFQRIYHAGPGPDVPCTLTPLTDSEKWKLQVKRGMVDGINTIARKERARFWVRKAQRQGDPLSAWIPRKEVPSKGEQ